METLPDSLKHVPIRAQDVDSSGVGMRQNGSGIDISTSFARIKIFGADIAVWLAIIAIGGVIYLGLTITKEHEAIHETMNELAYVILMNNEEREVAKTRISMPKSLRDKINSGRTDRN